MSRRKEIVKDVSIYTLSSYIAQVLDVINGVLVRRFLGPTQMGIWSFLQVVQNYAKHAGLGVTTATARDVPYHLGKGDTAKADEIKNLVFTFTTLTSLLVAGAVLGYAFWTRHQHSKQVFIGLFVIAGLIVLQRLYNLYIVLLRSHKEFVFTGLLNIASSFLGLALTLLLTWKFQLYGFFAAQILSFAALIVIIYVRTPYRFSYNWNWKALYPILSLGVTMVAVDILNTVLVHIDRVMIAKYQGFKELGYYSVALMASNYLHSFPNMISIIFFPHLQEVYAKSDDPKDLQKFLKEPTLCLAYLFPVLIGLVWVFSVWLVPVILPQYTEGLPALKWVILGSFFRALGHTFTSFLITVKKQWKLIPLQLILIAVGFGSTWLFIHAGWGLPGVAAANALIALSQFFILVFMSFSIIQKPGSAISMTVKTLGIFIYFAGTLAALDHLTGYAAGLSSAILKCIGFLTAMIPLFILAEKEIHIFSMILGMWKERRLKRSPKEN